MRQITGALQSLVDDDEQETHDLRKFLKSVRKYTAPEELTVEILNEMVNKIIVHALDKCSGHRRQRSEIYYKAAGIVNIGETSEKTAVAKRTKNGLNRQGCDLLQPWPCRT